jgi:hypothetical protein
VTTFYTYLQPTPSRCHALPSLQGGADGRCGRDPLLPRGPLVIVRRLPSADGRSVRSELDGMDRVVRESHIGLAEEERFGTAGGASPRASNQTMPVGLPLEWQDDGATSKRQVRSGIKPYLSVPKLWTSRCRRSRHETGHVAIAHAARSRAQCRPQRQRLRLAIPILPAPGHADGSA